METENLIPYVTTAATFSPVSVDQLKAKIDVAVTDSTHDFELEDVLAACVDEFERDTGIILASRTVRVNAETFYDGLQLQLRPIASITSVKYYDNNNTQQTLATTVYGLDAQKRQIRLKYNQTIPSYLDRWDAWENTYVVGYSTVQLVPALAKTAVLMLAAHRFENPDMLHNDRIFNRGPYEALVGKLMRSSYP